MEVLDICRYAFSLVLSRIPKTSNDVFQAIETTPLYIYIKQKAIMGFDKEQYHMVSEALQERANLVEIAPHLAYALPIMLPVYSWWQIPYYWAGIKVGSRVALGCLH